MPARYALRAHFSDGHSVDLAEKYDAEWRAQRAATNYINDYSDPCGLGVRVTHVAVMDAILEERASDKCGDYRCPQGVTCSCRTWAAER